MKELDAIKFTKYIDVAKRKVFRLLSSERKIFNATKKLYNKKIMVFAVMDEYGNGMELTNDGYEYHIGSAEGNGTLISFIRAISKIDLVTAMTHSIQFFRAYRLDYNYTVILKERFYLIDSIDNKIDLMIKEREENDE